MAFNILGTFQKNRRFWMAAILMICMVSFVFCTGMRGDMSERLPWLFGIGRSGQTVATVDGRTVTSGELSRLREQRNLANAFMKICADIAYKKLTNVMREESKKAGQDDPKRRKEQLAQWQQMQSTLAHRKTRNRYFEIGVSKFDDLLEFRVWQAEADRLGIQIEDAHLSILFREEFFYVLGDDELYIAQRQASASHQNSNNAMVRRAVAEEFRVKMAQFAVMGVQPYSFFFRRAREGEQGIPMKFDDPTVPDQTRTPITLGQLWDLYKANRSEFEVSLIPVPVANKLAKIDAPNEIQEKDYFNSRKDKAEDPSSDESGLEKPAMAKIEFLYADPKSSGYLDKAQVVAQLKVTPPSFDVFQSPLVTLTRFMALAEHEIKVELPAYYETVSRNPKNREIYHQAAPYTDADVAGPILGWMLAHRSPRTIAGLVAGSALAPLHPLDAHAAWAKFMVQVNEFRDKNKAEVDAAMQSEARRRQPRMLRTAAMMWGMSNGSIGMGPVFLKLDSFERKDWREETPVFTVETVRREIKELIALRTAEGWAQENMQIARRILSKAANDRYRFQIALNKLLKNESQTIGNEVVPPLFLTHGPTGNKKDNFYSRYTIDTAKEFSHLQEAYLQYIDMINMAEGRDATPERMLKPGDYYKMFFDGTQSFAAIGLYRPMPWPPEVTPSLLQTNRPDDQKDPTLVKRRNLNEAELERYFQHLQMHDPNKQAPPLDLFKYAPRPILYWRTDDLTPNRPKEADYLNAKKENIKKMEADLAKLAADIKGAKDKGQAAELQKKEAALKKIHAEASDLHNRIIAGWKFEEARKLVLKDAKQVAESVIKKDLAPSVIQEEAKKQGRTPIFLSRLSPMTPDLLRQDGFRRRVDYMDPVLPKDAGLEYPRDDMMKQVLSLHDLQAPLDVKNKELDEVNKELFKSVSDVVTKETKRLNEVLVELQKKIDDTNTPKIKISELQLEAEQRRGELRKLKSSYVQVLANKPRSVFYVALISSPPRENRLDFAAAMQQTMYQGGPAQEVLFRNLFRDLLVDRLQAREGNRYRAELVASLHRAHKVEVRIDDNARKDFDDKGSSSD